MPHVPPDCTHIKPLYAPDYDRFWAVCQDLGVVLNHHGGTGSPDYGHTKVALPIRLVETGWFSIRSYTHLLLAGVFERFRSSLHRDRVGLRVVPATLANLDALWSRMRTGMVGEFQFARKGRCRRKPSFYAKRNCFYGASSPSPRELPAATRSASTTSAGAATPAHYEGTYPHTEVPAPHLQRHGPQEVRAILGRTRRSSTASISRSYRSTPTSSARHRTTSPARSRPRSSPRTPTRWRSAPEWSFRSRCSSPSGRRTG